MSTMTRQEAKVVLDRVRHESSGRINRIAWVAFLVRRDVDVNSRTLSERHGDVFCGHTHGHRTQEAASTCGTKMWKRLPGAAS